MTLRVACAKVSIRARHGLFEILILTYAPPMTERLIELLREFPSDEPTRKRYIQEIIGWSGKFGPQEHGDPDLHHAAGSVYAEGWSQTECYCPVPI